MVIHSVQVMKLLSHFYEKVMFFFKVLLSVSDSVLGKTPLGVCVLEVTMPNISDGDIFKDATSRLSQYLFDSTCLGLGRKAMWLSRYIILDCKTDPGR